MHADETTIDNNPEGRSVKELCQAHMVSSQALLGTQVNIGSSTCLVHRLLNSLHQFRCGNLLKVTKEYYLDYIALVAP